ncbi:MAG TPA: hypothetical protein VIM73_22630 [Polyangiaceae bacterium]
MSTKIRGPLGLTVLLACLAYVTLRCAVAMNETYPLEQWLVWTYLEISAWVLLYSLACSSCGYRILVGVLRLPPGPLVEAAVLSMALGTVAFTLALYVLGALGLFNRIAAVLLPTGFLLAGGLPAWRLFRSIGGAIANARLGWKSLLGGAIGVAFVGLLYFRNLTPDALCYDASWFHVKLAQDYARWGAIRPFTGDYSHAHPQLASLLYTWGYLVPGLNQPQRWILAMHLELCLVLWTLAGVSAAIDRQLERPAPAMTWSMLFLFPPVFYFAPCGTADHVVAFFSIPTAIAVVRFWYRPSPANAALPAILGAGALLTRYQGIFLLVPAGIILLVACGRAWLSKWRSGGVARATRDVAILLAVLFGAGAAIVFPHFIKNVLFYGNPVYPFLQDRIASTPTVPDASLFFYYGMLPSGDIPKGTLGQKLGIALWALWEMSSLPRKFSATAGSLFVLLLPGVLLMPKSISRIFGVIAAGTLLVWTMVLGNQRYVLIAAPVVVAIAGAMAITLWRSKIAIRYALIPVFLLQLLWAADTPFSDHARWGIEQSMSLIQKSLSTRPRDILKTYREGYVQLGRSVPSDAKLLIHTFGPSLGIDRDLFMDSVGFQGLIDYRKFRTPRELFRELRGLGITHLVHEPGGVYGSPTIQEDILFFSLVSRYGTPVRNFHGLFLTAMPEKPPPEEQPYKVMLIGFRDPVDGLYPIEELFNPLIVPAHHRHKPRVQRRADEANPSELASAADAVVVERDAKLDRDWKKLVEEDFERVHNRIEIWSLYLRRPGTKAEPD